MKPYEARMLAFLKKDPFGRYFLPGYGHMKFVSPDATVSRRNIDTLYVHLLMWKPLMHVLIHHTLWEAETLALYWNFELKTGERVVTHQEFCSLYNACFPKLLEPYEDEDLHPKAKGPIQIEQIQNFHDFCLGAVGSKLVKLHTTHRPDLVARLQNL